MDLRAIIPFHKGIEVASLVDRVHSTFHLLAAWQTWRSIRTAPSCSGYPPCSGLAGSTWRTHDQPTPYGGHLSSPFPSKTGNVSVPNNPEEDNTSANNTSLTLETMGAHWNFPTPKLEFGRISFAYQGALVCNTLPRHLRNLNSRFLFQSNLKEFFQ